MTCNLCENARCEDNNILNDLRNKNDNFIHSYLKMIANLPSLSMMYYDHIFCYYFY